MARAAYATFEYSHDDEGLGQMLDFEVYFSALAGEPMVRYYPDGSGYPGSGPEVEFISARCVEITDEFRTWKPTDAEGRSVGAWFLEQIEIDADLRERLEERASEAARDAEEADYEAYCDSRSDG